MSYLNKSLGTHEENWEKVVILNWNMFVRPIDLLVFLFRILRLQMNKKQFPASTSTSLFGRRGIMETFSVIPSPKVSDTVVEPYNVA